MVVGGETQSREKTDSVVEEKRDTRLVAGPLAISSQLTVYSVTTYTF